MQRRYQYDMIGLTARRLKLPDTVADAMIALAELPPDVRLQLSESILSAREDARRHRASDTDDYRPDVALDVMLRKIHNPDNV